MMDLTSASDNELSAATDEEQMEANSSGISDVSTYL